MVEVAEFYRVVCEGGAGHSRPTFESAVELAESLRRHGWVEIIRHFEDEELGPTWKVVAELGASRG